MPTLFLCNSMASYLMPTVVRNTLVLEAHFELRKFFRELLNIRVTFQRVQVRSEDEWGRISIQMLSVKEYKGLQRVMKPYSYFEDHASHTTASDNLWDGFYTMMNKCGEKRLFGNQFPEAFGIMTKTQCFWDAYMAGKEVHLNFRDILCIREFTFPVGVPSSLVRAIKVLQDITLSFYRNTVITPETLAEAQLISYKWNNSLIKVYRYPDGCYKVSWPNARSQISIDLLELLQIAFVSYVIIDPNEGNLEPLMPNANILLDSFCVHVTMGVLIDISVDRKDSTAAIAYYSSLARYTSIAIYLWIKKILLCLNVDIEQAADWIEQYIGMEAADTFRQMGPPDGVEEGGTSEESAQSERSIGSEVSEISEVSIEY